MSENQPNQPQQPQQPQRNIHSAASPKNCVEMGERYGWKLLGWLPTGDKILKVDCVFEGEQTSFEDTRYD